MKRFHVSDKVVCIQAIKSVESFHPVPEVGRVYCVRDADDPPDPGLRLVGVQGVYEDGAELWLTAEKFRLLSDVQAENAKRKGAK